MTTLTQRHPLTRNAAIAFGGSIALALSAQLALPLTPVPVTFQTMMLLVLAIFTSPGVAASAAVMYLIEGALGIPVFAEFSGGLMYLLGPTGGYLLAFPVAVFVGSMIAYNKNSFWRILLAGLVMTVITLIAGTLFLSHFVGITAAITLGVAPFVLTEIIKVLAVAFGVSAPKRLSTKKSA